MCGLLILGREPDEWSPALTDLVLHWIRAQHPVSFSISVPPHSEDGKLRTMWLDISADSVCEIRSGGASGVGPHLGCFSGFCWQAPSLSHVCISCFLHLVTSFEDVKGRVVHFAGLDPASKVWLWVSPSVVDVDPKIPALVAWAWSQQWEQCPQAPGETAGPLRVLRLSPGSSPYSLLLQSFQWFHQHLLPRDECQPGLK